MISISRTAEDVTVVTLNHGKVNALDLELCQAISATFRELASAPHGGVVLTGAGSAFSAGVDLWRIVEGGPAYVRSFLPALVDAFEALFFCPQPVVVAANGHAIAGGCVMVACADYRLMSTGRLGIGIPELVVGVPFPAAAWDVMAYAVGAQEARRAAFTGTIYQPVDALALGYADELTAPEALLDKAVSHATRLASTIPAATFRLTKRTLRTKVIQSADLTEVMRLWEERAADGWIRDYLSHTLHRG